MNVIKLLCIALCLSCGFFVSFLYADDTSIEYKIKAGYLYNFTKFIIWSEDNIQTFNICILGEDPFGGLIDPIEQRVAIGRPIKLFRINQLDNKQHCHILYVNKSISENFANHNSATIQENLNTLFVGEGDLFATKIGLGFISREGKIKLKINLGKLQKNGLRVSAKLLEVAELVKSEEDDQ